MDLKGKPGADSGSVRGHRNIRLAEIIADEEQQLTDRLGQRVGEAVTEVEAGRVAPLAEAAERRAGNFGILSGLRVDLYTEPEKKLIQPALTLVSEASLHDDSGLHQRGDGKVRGRR